MTELNDTVVNLPQDDPQERRRVVQQLFDEVYKVPIPLDHMSDEDISILYENISQRIIPDEECDDGLDEQQRIQLGVEIRNESLRRHGLAISAGKSEQMMQRILLIDTVIDELGIRDSLLSVTGCPIPAEQPRRLDEAIRLLAKVTEINHNGKLVWSEKSNNALAIGDMQMGKTATFLLLAILTLEMSPLILPTLDLVVIVSGRPKEPRSQTIDAARVLTEWNGRTEFEVVSGRYSDLSKSNLDSHLISIVRCWRNNRIPVVIVKKDSNVLNTLIQLLNTQPMQGKKGLLLQDEADEAAVVQKDGKTLRFPEEGVHGKVSEIRDKLAGPYVGFTATENAIMMMPTGSSLFAKRIVMLTPGAAYRGPDYWLLQTPSEMNRPVTDIQQPVTADDANLWQANPPDSIGQFVMDYVVATSAKRLLHGNDIISKALMNISMRKDIHSAVSHSIIQILHRISDAVNHYASKQEWIEPDIARWWREANKSQVKRFEHFGIKCDYRQDPELFEEFLALCMETSQITRPFVLNEATDTDWDDEMNDVIVCAGAKAGRAIVFKGLTGIYMPLDPVVNAEDTNLQRLRQCGYRSPITDLPFMWQVMQPTYRNDLRKMVQTRMLQRTQLREYDMMNLDMRYNPVDRILPSRCALTGASRSGRAVPGNHGATATTRPIRDRVKINNDGPHITMASNYSDSDLIELLVTLEEHSERVAMGQVDRGIVFFNVDPRMLQNLANLCADPDAIAYLELQMDLHLENAKALNICFKLQKPVKGRKHINNDKFSDDVIRILQRLGWPFDVAFCNRRAINLDQEGNPVIDDNDCISVKQLVSSYIGTGENEDLGHDLALDNMASGGRTGSRLDGDPSLFTFGIYRLTLDRASKHDARLVAGNPPLLLCGVVSDQLAIAQRSVVNGEVVDNATAARSMDAIGVGDL